MAREPRLTHITALILQAVDSGFVYGFSIMEMTGLPSGTVYPAMRRMEEDQLIRSRWERQAIADREQRPARKYYQLTTTGKTALETSRKRYPLIERLVPNCGGKVMMASPLQIAVRQMHLGIVMGRLFTGAPQQTFRMVARMANGIVVRATGMFLRNER